MEDLNARLRKENEDLKYDNALLYEKNIQKDEKVAAVGEDSEKLRNMVEVERNKNAQMEKDLRYMKSRV